MLVRSAISKHEEANTSARVDSELSEELNVKVRMRQGSVLPPFLSAAVVDVITELAREGVFNKLLYADYLVMSSETIKGFVKKLR